MSKLIARHIRWCTNRGYSTRTCQEREALLRRLNDALPLGLDYAAEEEIEDWFAQPRKRPWSLSTRATYHRHAHGYYRWGYDKGLLEWDPMEDMPTPKAPYGKPRPLTDEQVTDILARARDPYRTFMILAVGAGLRCIEIAGLRREDITEQEIYIRRAKGGASAVVPNCPDVWAAVRHFPAGPIPEHLGAPCDERWISIRSAVYFRQQLRLPGVSLHRGRHTFARRLQDDGADPYELQEALRHKSVETVRVYAGPRSGQCAARIRALPPFTPTSS